MSQVPERNKKNKEINFELPLNNLQKTVRDTTAPDHHSRTELKNACGEAGSEIPKSNG
jgi:hypothetical protein